MIGEDKMKSYRKCASYFIVMIFLMTFFNLFSIFPIMNSSHEIQNTPIISLDQSSDFKDSILGIGNNISIDLFCENESNYINFTIQNRFLDFDLEKILDLPLKSDYRIYKVRVSLDNSKNLTAERNYFSTTTNISDFSTVEQFGGGFELLAAGQGFSLPYRSRLYNVSMYAATTGLASFSNGTIELRNNTPSGAVLNSMVLSGISDLSPKWKNYTYNMILDSQNPYFVIINGSVISDNRIYFWYRPVAAFPASFDGYTYPWIGSWTQMSFNHSFIHCYLPLNDTGTLPRNFTSNEVSLKINDSAVGNDNSIILEGNNITHLKFSTNISSRINSMTIRLYYIKDNQSVQTSYYGVVNQPTINWNITINIPFLPNFINGTYGINATIPSDWTVQTIVNGSPLSTYDSSNWVQSNEIVSIQNASSGSDPWILNCTAPNYLNQLTVEKWVAPLTYINITSTPIVNITETIRINGTLISSAINSGDGNLTIFDYADVANYSQVEDINPPVSGLLTFNDWAISQNATSNGTYTIQVIWYNGTEVGIRNILLEVIHHTDSVLTIENQLQVLRDPEKTWFIGLDNIINITILYNRTFIPTGISTPNSTYNVINETGGLWQSWTDLEKETLGTGIYNISIDVTSWIPGKYFVGLNLNLTGYFTQIRNITLNLVYNTSLTLLEPSPSILSSYYPENLTVVLNYSRVGAGIIPDATLDCYINGTGPQNIPFNGSLYRIQLNSTDLEVGNHNITIIASRFGSFTRQTNISWTIDACTTTYQLYVNGSYFLINGSGTYSHFHYGEFMNVSVFYNDTVHNWSIESAPLNLTLVGVGIQPISSQGNGWYTWIFDSSSRPAGLWDFILSVEKPNYINHTQSLELYAKYNTSLSWILPPPDSIRPGDELTVSVNLTSLGAPVAGQNVTFIINTNIGPDPYNVTTLANGSAMLVGYFITSETTTLSIQVSFYGNVTIFPSTISQSVQVKTGGWLEEYWWVLVIVALVAVVGTAAVRARRKQKIAKEIAKKEIITSFQDVTKILHLVVIHKGTGTDIFDYKIQERLDPTLLAGFIQAVKDFGGELDQEER